MSAGFLELMLWGGCTEPCAPFPRCTCLFCVRVGVEHIDLSSSPSHLLPHAFPTVRSAPPWDGCQRSSQPLSSGGYAPPPPSSP